MNANAKRKKKGRGKERNERKNEKNWVTFPTLNSFQVRSRSSGNERWRFNRFHCSVKSVHSTSDIEISDNFAKPED